MCLRVFGTAANAGSLRSPNYTDPLLNNDDVNPESGCCGFKKHPSNEHKADIWTNLAAFGEGISSGFSNFYWGISLAELISSLCISEETPPALSWGLGIGFTAFAIGSIYAHRKLNIFHQHGHSHAEVSHGHSHGVNEGACGHSHGHGSSSMEQNKGLRLVQKAALFADFISHTGDVCGPISAGFDGITKTILKTSLPPWGNATVQLVSVVIAAHTAVGNVRSCKHAIVAQN